MASKGQVESLIEEVICPICLDFFTDPVSLECSHNFCRSCITRCWQREERNSCPECREEFADRTLRVNRVLANLSEKARKLNLNPKEKESKLHCEEHEEELKLFCETDRKLICLICRDALEHKSHNFMPIKEAVKIYQDRVKSSLDSLVKKKSDFQEKEQQQKEKISGVREQSQSVQSHITSQFDELRRIITEKEQRVLRDLREEEERILNPMEKNLQEIQENLNAIYKEISKLQEQMDQQDNIIFLMEEARRKRRISEDVHTLSVTDGALLVEKFDHPYLLDIASEEVIGGIKHVSVTLDVETAHPRLEVSEDRKSVRYTGTRRNLPDTGKRFTDRACVLGSEGFTSGRHYWEVEVTGNRGWSLGEVICPICLDFFTDPVSLECGHYFCRSCITRCWEREERNSCPECREEFADRSLKGNRVLANLSEKARKLNLNPKEKESKLHCEEHEEELKLFCETDRKLICLICRDALEHKSHNFMPIKEAVKIYQDRVKSSLDSLAKMKSDFQEMEQQQKEKISGVREQSQSVQSHITSQFDELRQIITEKEQRVLRDLREEEERILNPMEKNLREIQENLNAIYKEISKLQEQIDQQDNIIFLMEEARRKRRISEDAHILSVTDGALLVEKFHHPYLLDIASEEVIGGIKHVSVTLDVETAHSWLEVSEDRKSVRRTGTRRDLPDTGKRFTYWLCVLGSEGFTSGRHYWEVEVTGNRRWSLGVAAESVKRKRLVTWSPETGFWRIARVDDVMKVLTSPLSRLPAGPIPGRVGVYLSYESGTVSFYNAETKSHLHTFTGNKFTEKLYPFFGFGYKNEWLRICSGSAPGLEEARRKRRISDDIQTLSVTDGALLVEKFDHPYLLDIASEEVIGGIKHGSRKIRSPCRGKTSGRCRLSIRCVWVKPWERVLSPTRSRGRAARVSPRSRGLSNSLLLPPVSVTLDVETANPELEVSEDRKSVRYTGTRRNLPDTGKRFTVWGCVLGSEGFTSGRHYWEVEVTGNLGWGLGVAAESVERKGGVTVSTETGFWIIARIDDEMLVYTSPGSRLPAGPIPGRVGVYLSYESRTVSFYNAETKSHLHTFTGNKFTEKLYPFFGTGYKNEWLRVCSGSAPGL
ncbi:uncharacterized protein [Hemitrygon akajei]|uniref:uncharacterized protein n=1 Tax=Hemitrygon akajei TaxID=2704970 RepID=UPI003BF9DF76